MADDSGIATGGSGPNRPPIDPDVRASDVLSSDVLSSDVASTGVVQNGVLAPGARADHVRAAAPQPPAGLGRPIRRRGRERWSYLARRVRRVLVNRGDILAVIAAGGAVGSLARWGLTLALPHPTGTFPWATFIANVTGCLLIGVLMVFVMDVWPPSRYVRPFLGVGVLGGYTTFSTYMLDARALLVAGRTALAGRYVFGSLLAGLAAVWVGVTLARVFVRLATRWVLGRREAAPAGVGPEAERAAAGRHGPPDGDRPGADVRTGPARPGAEH